MSTETSSKPALTLKTPLPPRLIRASAGSGKTFELSNRFIQLLLAGESPDAILATTFTRKAAGEVRARVLSRLAKGAKSDQGAAQLAAELGVKGLKASAVAAVLERVVRQQHRLAIWTIDKLCSQIASLLPFDTDLPLNWRLAESGEAERLVQRTLTRFFQRREDLVALFRELRGDRDRGRLYQELEGIIAELFSKTRGADPEGWSWLTIPPPVSEAEMDAIAERFDLLPLPEKHTTNFRDVYQKDRALILNRRLRELPTSGIMKNLLEGKKDFHRVPIPEPTLALYEEIRDVLRASERRTLARHNAAIRQLIADFATDREFVLTRDRRVTFDDVKFLLAKASSEILIDEVYYRLDCRFRHLLLDEFQDTSGPDWQIIEPMAAEILSKLSLDNTFFCVGDVKQAIYGFRGGRSELFDRLSSAYPVLIPESKDLSRRSSTAVIETVNRVFEQIGSNAALIGYQGVAREWQERFNRHTAYHSERTGYVRATVVTDETGEPSTAGIFEQMVATVKEIHAVNPGIEIGILVPKNAQVNGVIRALSSNGIHASEEGGVPLTSSPAVLVFLSLCILLDHPGDTLALFHVAGSPLGERLTLVDRDPSSNAAILTALREEAIRGGLGPLLARLMRETRGRWSRRCSHRLNQLLELAFVFDTECTLRFAEFVQQVERHKVEAVESAMVRVMTIHKSKGLEFDAVILPALDDSFFKKPDRYLYHYDDPTAPPVRMSKRPEKPALLPELEPMMTAQSEGEVAARLNLLYVALTRARHALYLFTGESQSVSHAAIFWAAVGCEPRYEIGDSGWASKLSGEIARAEAPAPLPIFSFRPSREDRVRMYRSPSEPVAPALPSAGWGRELSNNRAALRGLAVHRIMQQIEWLPVEGEIERGLALCADLRLTLEERLAVRQSVLDFIQKPDAAAHLRRESFLFAPESPGRAGGAGETTVRVLREQPVAYREGSTLVSGVVDRIVIAECGERRQVWIYDYKSDAAGGTTELLKKYRTQLGLYAVAVGGLLRIDPTSIRLVLLFVATGEVVTIDP